MKHKLLSVISVLLCVVLLLAGCGSNTKNNRNAENNGIENHDVEAERTKSVWDGTIATSFSKGNGTSENPYIIKKASELAFVAQSCSEGHTFSGQYIELGCDIDLNGKEWNPIGVYTSHYLLNVKVYRNFEGIFDGKGHTISNFKIAESQESGKYDGVYYGLFGSTFKATISNLIIKDYFIDLTSDNITVGGLVGRCDENCCIDNCHSIDGDITVSFVEHQAVVGGLIGNVSNDSAGRSNYTVISNCSTHNKIKVNCLTYKKSTYLSTVDGERIVENKGKYRVGGLIGVEASRDSMVFNCVSSGIIHVNIDATENDLKPLWECDIGGFAAIAICQSVKNCYSTTDIILNRDFGLYELGGFIGLCEDTEVTNCYSLGSINLLNPEHKVTLGGFVGQCTDTASIHDCFVSASMDWSLKDDNGNYFIGEQHDYLKDIVNNCYVSANSAIKNNHADNDTEIYKVISEETLKDKSFLQNSMGFQEYDATMASTPLAVSDFPGWIFSDDLYPVLFFEKDLPKREAYQVDPKITTASKETIKLIGKTTSEVIKVYGESYSLSGNNMSYSNLGIVFVMSVYPASITGNELITGIYIRGDFDIGNRLNANMTYEEIKAVVKNSEKPTYLEIDGTYAMSIIIGDYVYSFSWKSNDFNEKSCDWVYVAFKQ